MALILVGVLIVIVGIAVQNAIAGHLDNLSNPDLSHFTVGFWLFVVWFVWAIITKGDNDSIFTEATFWFWVYTIIALPLCLYCFWQTIQRMANDD